jgi:opacity protein-like surface antigen
MKFKTAAIMAAVTAALGVARADERFFTYVYEADVLPKGEWEFEQHLTYRQGNPGGDEQFDQYLWDFRSEIEYSPFERLSTALYLNFQQDTVEGRAAGLEGTSDFSFEGISLEAKYQLLNPVTDPVGLALYLEPTFNGNEIEFEQKVILSKNLGERWVLAANATVEQEWETEEGETEKESVFELSTGAAYRFTSHWSVGLEGRYRNVYEGLGFDERLGTAWFLGPNIHYGSAKWWATLTGLPQIAGSATGDDRDRDLVEHQKFEIRLIFGIDF